MGAPVLIPKHMRMPYNTKVKMNGIRPGAGFEFRESITKHVVPVSSPQPTIYNRERPYITRVRERDRDRERQRQRETERECV